MINFAKSKHFLIFKAHRDIPISPTWYFNQKLLNFNQYFASGADYLFFARSVDQQHHFRSSINFIMYKVKPGTLAAGTIESNFKGTVKRFVARNITFSFMSSVKETPAYWKQFLNDVLTMAKQLGIPTYFLTLSCANLRWEELPHIINKLNNLGLRDEDLKSLSCEERSNLLKHNPVFVARHFQYKVVFFLS